MDTIQITLTNDAGAEDIRRQLSPAERLLWYGRPRPGIRVRGADALVIPFSLLWGGFAIFWEWMVITSGAPFFFILWGIPFVLVGLYMMVGRFFVEAKLRERTAYGVTSERVLIISGLFGRKIKSLNLRTLSDLSLSEQRDGTGTISFGGNTPFGSAFGGMKGWPGIHPQTGPRFDWIPNAKAVYDIIRNAQRDAT